MLLYSRVKIHITYDSYFPACCSPTQSLDFFVLCVVAHQRTCGTCTLGYFTKPDASNWVQFIANGKISFFFMSEQQCHLLFIHPSLEGHLACSHACLKLHCYKSGLASNYLIGVSFRVGAFPGVRWRDHRADRLPAV